MTQLDAAREHLRNVGLTDADITNLEDLGIALSAIERYVAAGITEPSDIQRLNKAGITGLSARQYSTSCEITDVEEMIQLHAFGLSSTTLRELLYSGIPLKDARTVAYQCDISNVPPAFMKSIQCRMRYDHPTAAERIIDLWAAPRTLLELFTQHPGLADEIADLDDDILMTVIPLCEELEFDLYELRATIETFK